MNTKTVVKNHGYCFVLYPLNMKEPFRIFGSFKTPANALEACRKFLEVKIDCPDPNRPVLHRRYGFKSKETTYAYVTLKTLENVMFDGISRD